MAAPSINLLAFFMPLVQGTQSPPFFLMVLDLLAKAIPNAQRKTFATPYLPLIKLVLGAA
jgi:hypothetical protein